MAAAWLPTGFFTSIPEPARSFCLRVDDLRPWQSAVHLVMCLTRFIDRLSVSTRSRRRFQRFSRIDHD
jgi:hypothetical protein